MSEPGPLDAKAAFDTARRELKDAIAKKRAIDKTLVRFCVLGVGCGPRLSDDP